MSVTNKLIETIAENYIEAMTAIIGHASEYGDRDTIDKIIEILRDHDELPRENDDMRNERAEAALSGRVLAAAQVAGNCPTCGRYRGGP